MPPTTRARRAPWAAALAAVVLLTAAPAQAAAPEAPGSPHSRAASVSAPAPAPYARTRALFFGDSYIIGGPYAGPGRTMAALAARRLGWESVLRGGGGTGFASGNPEYGLGDFLTQIRGGALDVGPVDWLVIEGGSNDRFLPARLITRRAARTVRAAAKRHPEARIVLVGTFDPTVDGFTDTDRVTAALARAAKRAKVAHVVGQRWLEGRPDLVGPDYDHPTRAGNVLLGRKLARALRDVRR